jgi:hypothetical protein
MPHTFHDGIGENASGVQVNENLTYLMGVLDQQLAKPRLLDVVGAWIPATQAAGTFAIARHGMSLLGPLSEASAGVWLGAPNDVAWVDFHHADWDIAKKELQILAKVAIAANEVAPGITVTARLVRTELEYPTPAAPGALAMRYTELASLAVVPAQKAGESTRVTVGPLAPPHILKAGGGEISTPLAMLLSLSATPATGSAIQVQASIYRQYV